MNQDNRTFNKIASVVFLQMAYTFLLFLLFAIVMSLTLQSDGLIALLTEATRPSFKYAGGVVLSVFTIYLSMLTLSKKFGPEDLWRIPGWLAAVSCGLGILFSVFGQHPIENLFNVLVIPCFEFLTAYFFLSRQHR